MLRSFVLKLEGTDEDLQRVLKATFNEMSRIGFESHKDDDYIFGGGPVPRLCYVRRPFGSLKGTITYKEGIPA